MLILKHYAYEIFDIARSNNVEIKVARDLFLANIRAGKKVFDGEKETVKYANLKKEYQKLSEDEKNEMIVDFNDFLKLNHQKLSKLHAEEKEKEFKDIAGIVNTLKSTSIDEEDEY